jgi:Na+-translocating ferredoxin:NAD+ oxidoreductase RnfG subunit
VVEELVRGITRAIVYSIALLCVANILLGTLRQEAKEAIEYAAQTAVDQAIDTILSDPDFNQAILPKIKQSAKEAIEYTVDMASRKMAIENKSKK